MTREEVKEIAKKVMWGWFHEELPKLFIEDEEDDVGEEVTVSFGSYMGTMSWLFEQDGSELMFVLGNDGSLSVTISEVCHATETIMLAKLGEDVDIEILETDVYALCTIFTSGNVHVFMDLFHSDMNISDLRMTINAYIDFEKTHPDILRNITYIHFKE